MSREHDELSKRPERVIILDADDPMTEIHGAFVWREEHDRVVEQVRRQAFAERYQAGACEPPGVPVEIRIRRRPGIRGYFNLAVLILLGLFVLLMLPIILS